MNHLTNIITENPLIATGVVASLSSFYPAEIAPIYTAIMSTVSSSLDISIEQPIVTPAVELFHIIATSFVAICTGLGILVKVFGKIWIENTKAKLLNAQLEFKREKWTDEKKRIP